MEVEKWGQTDSSLAGKGSCGSPAVNGAIEVGMVAPQTGYVVALSSEIEVVSHGASGDRTQFVSTVAPIAPQIGEGIAVISETMAAEHDDGGDNAHAIPVLRPCLGSGSSSDGSHKAPLAGKSLVFKAGGSGSGSVAKAAGSSVRGPKFAGVMLQRARKALSRGSGARRGAGPVPNRPNPPTPLPIRPEAAVPGAVSAGPPEGAKVHPKFFEIIKDNRIVGNGLKLQQYDPMENDVMLY
ncbi:hypothetical protein LIER_40763 [Lithospermum erythrorhizon]|uniref:Uncharacterized protein n=1 Tax=Lithospermum erythrorhizon TaxID=34254 RepID=A0AAV3QZ83_LITER